MFNLSNVTIFSFIILLAMSNFSDASDHKTYPIPVVPLTNHPEPKFRTSNDLPYEEKQFPCALPLKNGAQAAFCIEHDFTTRTGELYNHAQDSGHLGNTGGQCGSNTKGKVESYFSSNEQLFTKTLHDAKVACQLNSKDPTTFFCLGETSEDMCYIDGRKVKTLRAVINKTTGHMVSFSPSQYGSDHIK